jgi:pimeloyl-ACP methyl ester carboxylesterase
MLQAEATHLNLLETYVICEMFTFLQGDCYMISWGLHQIFSGAAHDDTPAAAGGPSNPVSKALSVVSESSRMLASSVAEASIFSLKLLASPIVRRISFKPIIKEGSKPPILLLHGSNSFEGMFVVGRHYLKKEKYGSLFSLNYDDDRAKGIDNFAQVVIREKILEIKQLTKQNNIILIGHSMGGLVAGYYAEHCADEDGVSIEHVISIGSPWQGAQALSYLPDALKTKRYSQMSPNSEFIHNLMLKTLESEKAGKRRYYNIGGECDLQVSGSHSFVTLDPKRQRIVSGCGHNALLLAPAVWSQIATWLDNIDKEQEVVERI